MLVDAFGQDLPALGMDLTPESGRVGARPAYLFVRL